MLEFGNLKYMWLIVFPIGILITVIYGFIKKNKILSSIKLFTNRKIEIIRVILYGIGGALLFIALLSPQKLIEDGKKSVNGIDVYVLFDTSNSMLAEDVYPNRLEQGKKSILGILNGLKGDMVGFIPFSGSAYVQMPLTDDYQMAENYLEAINSDMISGGSTDLLSALKIADNSFKESATKNKVVLLVSDGGEENQDIIKYLEESKIKVFSIGVGTEEGSVIPNLENGVKNGFIKDKNNEAVITKLNSKFMKLISEDNYYEVNNLKNESNGFLDEFSKLEKEKLKEKTQGIYKRYYQTPLLIGLLLIMLAYFYKGEIKNEK